jgi:hypothetical protein
MKAAEAVAADEAVHQRGRPTGRLSCFVKDDNESK